MRQWGEMCDIWGRKLCYNGVKLNLEICHGKTFFCTLEPSWALEFIFLSRVRTNKRTEAAEYIRYKSMKKKNWKEPFSCKAGTKYTVKNLQPKTNLFMYILLNPKLVFINNSFAFFSGYWICVRALVEFIHANDDLEIIVYSNNTIAQEKPPENGAMSSRQLELLFFSHAPLQNIGWK